MKKLFCLAGVFVSLSVARAHESWAPHTHTIDNQRSDLFILCLTGLGASGAGLLLVRWLRNRRQLKACRTHAKRH